jgi:hypothetical protein
MQSEKASPETRPTPSQLFIEIVALTLRHGFQSNPDIRPLQLPPRTIRRSRREATNYTGKNTPN